MTLDAFRKQYAELAQAGLSERQAYRWLDGGLKSLPYPHAQATLERLFGEPVARLFGPPYGTGVVLPGRRFDADAAQRGHARDDWQGQVIAMSAERARDFLSRAEATNVGAETLDQLADDVRRLTVAYQQEPLERLLGDMGDTQDRAFGLLEGRQRPEQTRDLYLLAGVASGLMAKASHDLGAPHDAMTQARAAYTCADNAGHDGLRAWTRGLQSLIAYWSGRLDDSVRYALRGSDAATRSQNSAGVWLAASEARVYAALGQVDESNAAIERATEAREHVRPDELDDLGGLCTFKRPKQLYYAADSLAWGGREEAEHTELLAIEALDAYDHAPVEDRSFSDEAGTRCALAVSRLVRGEVEGAVDAVTPVLELPPAQRIHGIIVSVGRVQGQLASIESGGRTANDLAEAAFSFTSQPLALRR
ncbi:MAG: XRE family transcriptional regulator [Pseudonocardiaceae bacterium]|nr:XRE family transcriptional regulator [Pseudonocardiaceae bacterium]